MISGIPENYSIGNTAITGIVNEINEYIRTFKKKHKTP
jgi:hypothetical protein